VRALHTARLPGWSRPLIGPAPALLQVGVFASATPVGIFMGYGLSGVASGKGGAAMSALASGTFLYVAMMEIIPKELADPTLRLPKLCMLLLGFGLMSLLAVWA
jgi:zinc transporter 1/2/3